MFPFYIQQLGYTVLLYDHMCRQSKKEVKKKFWGRSYVLKIWCELRWWWWLVLEKFFHWEPRCSVVICGCVCAWMCLLQLWIRSVNQTTSSNFNVGVTRCSRLQRLFLSSCTQINCKIGAWQKRILKTMECICKTSKQKLNYLPVLPLTRNISWLYSSSMLGMLNRKTRHQIDLMGIRASNPNFPSGAA